MHTSFLRRALRGGLAATALGLALPTCVWADSFTFSLDAPLSLGGALSGSFSGADVDADLSISGSELSNFMVTYVGAPPATSSFSIDKSVLDLGDLFSFDTSTNSLSFSVTDALGRSVSAGSFEFASVIGDGFVDAGGGTLTVSAVPEPTSLALMAGGLGLLAAAKRRRSAAQA